MTLGNRENDHDPVQIGNEPIEQVEQYKYLGTIIDSKLSWKANTDAIYKKAQRRLHFLRCLRQLHVDKTIMMLFFNTFIMPILCFNFLGWFGNLTLKSQNVLRKPVNIASKIIGTQMKNLDAHYKCMVLRKVKNIMKDSNHSLYHEFVWLPSGRRLRSAAAKSKRTLQSFVPLSIRLFNQNK